MVEEGLLGKGLNLDTTYITFMRVKKLYLIKLYSGILEKMSITDASLYSAYWINPNWEEVPSFSVLLEKYWIASDPENFKSPNAHKCGTAADMPLWPLIKIPQPLNRSLTEVREQKREKFSQAYLSSLHELTIVDYVVSKFRQSDIV